ncbi:MAG TPA: alpha/beta fold hydrolase [Candidatus Acidoferrum sp.]|jgi:alpha-beta hydrolase superfamily lysophospholipase|nr:alpha/beta fold hydrolase [Candidatus Acidoferrum sp.]
MHQLSDQTSALLERFRRRDHGGVADAGRTKLLLHGEVRPVAVVLFHGIAASPEQFVRFAHELHARGHNVVVPRLPRHGHRDRLTDALARLSADDLRAFGSESIELAQGLGERVVVAGFSLGGLLATWAAQRYPIDRAVAIAPFFGMSWMPIRFTAPFADLVLKLPNVFAWWNPLVRERQQPEHGYPRYSSHAIAQSLLVAREVFARAGESIAARELILVTNAKEAAVSNRAVRQLARLLRARPGGRLEHVVLRGIPISHDIIEPLRHVAIADQVFPELLDLIDRPL